MIIVDASVAVKWVVSESGSTEAAALLERGRLGAPTLWLSEASNALWAKVMRQQLTAEEARGQAAELADAPIVPIALPELLPLTIRLALELAHPIYDCFYLAAAIQKDTHLVTADRRFVEKTRGQQGLAGRVKRLSAV